MSRRLLLTLFAALMLLCAGVSGVARAAVLTVTAADVDLERGQSVSIDPAAPAQTPHGFDIGTAVEMADASMLPADESVLPLWHGMHRTPCPVLDAGHPTPCLAGLLRPPCRRA
jgi:hypothetical protein